MKMGRYLAVGRQYEHVAIAERALGRRLPKKAVIHHMDCNPYNNAPENLVICPNQRYHFLLHLRMRALDACGNSDYRRCGICLAWDDPTTMYICNGSARHKKCSHAQAKFYKERKNARN